MVLENLENEQFGVEDLSKEAGISRSQLHRKLKILKGKSVSQFIREVRLEEAMKMLQNEEATASEIAYRVGFSSPSYFYKCFQQYYGFPAGEVKKLQLHAHDIDITLRRANSKKNEHWITITKNKPVFLWSILSLIIILVGFFGYHYFNSSAKLPALEKSIAVLPFTNLSEDKENQHFADGLVDDLLNRLALINELDVTSRTSSDYYRERGKKIVPEIASELGVSYIVEGSVQKYDNKVRITVQLIDAKNDSHIWTDTFDRNLFDVFKIQSEIAIQVASALSTVLTDQETLNIQKNQTENVKAFELYQLGRFYWGKRIHKEYETAIHYFEQAIGKDPDYALAYAGLADTYYLMNWSFTDLGERMKLRDKAEELALKALELDPKLAEAYTVLATLNVFIDWDWAAAEKRFQQAFKINSNYSTLHHRYSEFLSYTGRHKEARKHINKAIELDPLSFVIRRVSTKLYFNRGLLQEALAEAKISQELNINNSSPYRYRFMIHYLLCDDQAALLDIKQLEIVLGSNLSDHFLDSVYNKSGLDGLIRCRMELFNWLLTNIHFYSLLGENDKAMDLLEVAFKNGDPLPDVPYWYSPNNLQADPRFISLMGKMGLPWKPDSSQ